MSVALIKYDVLSYDVWGNAKDGYEVNDVHHTSLQIEVPQDATDKQIIQALKRVGYLNRNLHFKSIEVKDDGGDGHSIYITHLRDYYPLCELRKVESK